MKSIKAGRWLSKVSVFAITFGISLIATAFLLNRREGESWLNPTENFTSDISPAEEIKQLNGYSAFSPGVEYKLSVKSETPTPKQKGTDSYVDCYSPKKCGGGKVTIKESECVEQKCCEYSPGEWKILSESDCFQKQIDSYGQFHDDLASQNLSPTSQQMMSSESPNLAAICASEKAVTISRVKGGLLKKIKSMETPDFHLEDIYVKQVYLNSIKAIYDNAVRKAEQLGIELEHYCLNHNGSVEGFQMPLYYE